MKITQIFVSSNCDSVIVSSAEGTSQWWWKPGKARKFPSLRPRVRRIWIWDIAASPQSYVEQWNATKLWEIPDISRSNLAWFRLLDISFSIQPLFCTLCIERVEPWRICPCQKSWEMTSPRGRDGQFGVCQPFLHSHDPLKLLALGYNNTPSKSNQHDYIFAWYQMTYALFVRYNQHFHLLDQFDTWDGTPCPDQCWYCHRRYSTPRSCSCYFDLTPQSEQHQHI